MHRLARLNEFWSWLPAFRAVAETEHLPSAARSLLVGPPALSRAVKLLERSLGQPLFRREGRHIRLNEAGERFLAVVREAMQTVHEGSLALHGPRLEGPLQIASAGLITTAYLVPGLQALRREHPGLLPAVVAMDPQAAVQALLRGEVDVAFGSAPLAHRRVVEERLGEEPNGVYCGPGHVLYRRRRVRLLDVLEHEFVAPLPDESGRSPEGWPAELRRRIGLHVDQMRLGADVCAQGELLAVLPDVIASAYAGGSLLRRLPVDVVPATPLFVGRRSAPESSPRVVAVVEAVRAQILQRGQQRRPLRGRGIVPSK